MQPAAELESSNRDLRRLALHLILIEESERRRIAQQIHDRIGQSLSLCSLQIGRLIRSSSSDALSERLKEIQATVKDVLDETRVFVSEISPSALYDFGLGMAVKRLTEVLGERNGVSIIYEEDDRPKDLDEDIRVVLFHVTRECLANAVRHANATEIKVRIARWRNEIRITVQDNGVGSDANDLEAEPGGEMGLFGAGELMRHIGGSAKIGSDNGGGTVVTISVPLKQRPATKTESQTADSAL